MNCTKIVAGLKVYGAVWVWPDPRALVAYRGVTTAGEPRHASFERWTNERTVAGFDLSPYLRIKANDG